MSDSRFAKTVSLEKCSDTPFLTFSVCSGLSVSVAAIIRDDRKGERQTHCISVYSETEKKDLIQGLLFLVETLKETIFPK